MKCLEEEEEEEKYFGEEESFCHLSSCTSQREQTKYTTKKDMRTIEGHGSSQNWHKGDANQAWLAADCQK